MAKVIGEATPPRPAYVRICPVCDTANPPERARCACGASLAGIDFSLLAPPPAGEAAAPPGDAAPPADGGEAAAPAVEANAIASSSSVAQAAAGAVVCPYPDCLQANPPGSDRCVYCNRPLAAPAPATVAGTEAAAPASTTVAGARPLPAALRDRYRVIEAFPATGSEADILLVVDARTGAKAVAKLYRMGIKPDFRLLDILAKSVGETVVRVLDHGVSDGAAFELLEYVPGGTLEALMRAGPLPRADIRRIVLEIADALGGIHAHHILHRDLKPENVLVRTASPLHLALTDFGIASISVATQHFTSVARTTRYAAPEVLTGVLDAKSDWWSLGMIALEAASGRHPFDGLTEQVMNHQLATRPIDVRGVYDDDLRMLCRGLLLRDPKKRWGRDEVARWLEGDRTLAVAEDAEGAATSVRAYRIGKTEATTAGDLALALAKHWDAARRDMQRGQVARWLEQELHDYNLLRTLRDIQETRDITDDGRLLRFLLAAAPDLPPVWKGSPVTPASILAAARAAAGEDGTARDWLDSLARDGVLKGFADAGDEALRDIDRRWREAWQGFVASWKAAERAEDAWHKAPRDVGGDAPVVSFDDLAYASPGRLPLPPQRDVNGALLLALLDRAYVEALEDKLRAGVASLGEHCPWLPAVWEKARETPAGVVAAHAMLPFAREAAAGERKRRSATAQARARTRVEARDDLRAGVSRILALSPRGDEDLPNGAVADLLDAFSALQAACQRVASLDPADDDEELRRSAEKLSVLAMHAQRALADVEQAQGINAIIMTPQRLAGGALVIGAALLLRVPIVMLGVIGAVALVVAWRWYAGYRATESVLAKLRVFGLHGRTFLRGTDPPEATASG